MAAAPSAFQAIVEVLLREEGLLLALIEQVAKERQALIDSDFDALSEVTQAMLKTAAELDQQESRRDELLAALGLEGATLTSLLESAAGDSPEELSDARERLLERAEELRSAQEQNANLLLSAATMRERWLRLLTNMASPTYGARGEQRSQDQRFISRSA